MKSLIVPQAPAICRKPALRGLIPRLKPRGCLILFLALTFFLFCPLWAYLSICGLSAHDNARQGCFLYSFVFNMPVSLPPLAILLVILASVWLIADCRQARVFRAPIYRVLARAPPLS